MNRAFAFAVCALMATAAVPATAQVIDVPLGVIVVPPTQTFAEGLTFALTGESGANFEFIISQAATFTVSSFTNSSFGNTGVFDFTSINLYSGFGIDGDLLQTGTISTDGNTRRASLDQFSLDQGAYTIAYRGTVTGPPAGVGSNITFAAGTPDGPTVPEPATWGLMILGFGAIGATLRRRATRVSYAV